MQSDTLVQHHPPTPPGLNPDLHAGLHQIAQYNDSPDYAHEGSPPYSTGYSSISPVMHEASQHSPHMMSHVDVDGLGIRYDGYGSSSTYQRESSFNRLPNKSEMFSGSPLTPSSATEHDDVTTTTRRMRNGRTIIPSTPPGTGGDSRPKATPKSKRSKLGKSDKPKTPKLTAPLSVLTKGMTFIPVRNMEEWVNRSADVRRKEVEKRNGYITRPMNSFMLYRSAYAERTKQWCLQNNHQVVSSVSGESWPLEPPEIRDLYNEYAKIERINHQNAHPTYKFSPSKTSVPARKSKRDLSNDGEPSDLDDADFNPGSSRSKTRQSKRSDRSTEYPTNGMNDELFDRSFSSNGMSMHRPTWEMVHEGRPMPMPMPMPMAQGDLYSQYYQASMDANMGMNHNVMDDLRMRRIDTPASSIHFSPDHGLIGLPGGNATDFMQQMQQMHSQVGTPMSGDGQVDPMLLAFDSGHHHDGGVAAPHPDLRNSHLAMVDREFDQHSMDRLMEGPSGQEDFHHESWQPDPNMGPMEHESEFEKWIGDH